MKKFGLYSVFYINTPKKNVKHTCIGFKKIGNEWCILSDSGQTFPTQLIESLVERKVVSLGNKHITGPDTLTTGLTG